MRLIPSFCALACASALPLAAPAQTVAETPAPETAPETAGRTVLDVTASGTLTGLAADALGPDAALTVRLHGPVAFDVDTADFASLEIFADDPAVKLTVSDTAAYDRITAVSIPAAASGEPAAATFSAAAASAGIATLADTATTPTKWVWTPQNGSTDWTNTENWVADDGTTHPDGYPQKEGGWSPTSDKAWLPIEITGPETGGPLTLTTNAGIEGWNFDLRLTNANLTFTGNVVKFQTDDTEATALRLRNSSSFNLNPSNTSYGHWELFDADIGDGCEFNIRSAVSTISNEYAFNVNLNSSGLMTLANWTPPKDVNLSFTLPLTSSSDVKIIRERPLVKWSGDTCNLDGVARTVTTSEGVTLTANPSITSTMSADEVAAFPVGTYNIVKSSDAKTISVLYVDYSDAVVSVNASSTSALTDVAGVTAATDVFVTLEANGTFTLDSAEFRSLTIDNSGAAMVNLATNIDFSKVRFTNPDDLTLVLGKAGPTSFVPADLPASCNIEVAKQVTLTVGSTDVSPYWTVDGTLTIVDGGTLTVDVAEGVTVPNPYKVIQANTISVASGATLTTPESSAYKAVPVDNNAVWVISNKSIRPKNPVSDEMSWSSLRTSEWVTEGGGSVTSPVQITTESSVVLELANGATLTVDESILDSGTVPELALRVTGGGTATIAVSDGCRFPFAKTTVAVGTVRVEGAADLGAVTIADGATLEVTHPFTSVAGSGTLVLDATAGNIEVDPTLRDSIRTRDAKVILRSNTSGFGVTLDYGVNVNASFQAHLVVESGTHKMTYGQGGAYDFSTTGTTANPTIWVKQGATLEFTAKDISGWTGAANHKAVIRVDEGGYLKIWKKDSNTFYYRQCLYLEPGADMEIGSGFSSENKFRLIGGTEEATAQIFVPDSAQAGTEAATISGGSLTLGNDATNGLAISVGNNSELKIGSELSNHADTGSPTLAKYGSGVLTLSSVASAFRSPVTVNAGTMRLSGVDAFGRGAVTLQSGATLEIVEGSNGAATTALSNAISGAGTLMVTSGSVSLTGNTVACDVSVKAGASLGGTGTITDTLTFADGSTLDASAGVLTVSGLMLPASGTVTVKVAEGAEAGTVLLTKADPTIREAQKFIVSGVAGGFVTIGDTGLVLGKMTASGEGVTLPDAATSPNLAAAVQQAAAASGATSVELAYGTSGGVQLDAMTAEAGAALFTGITTTTTEASTTTVTVAYDFGITGITVSGNDIEVTAKVQGSGGASAGYASGTTVTLYKDGQNTGETGTIGNDGTVTFTLSDGLNGISDNTAAKFTVKAEKATP